MAVQPPRSMCHLVLAKRSNRGGDRGDRKTEHTALPRLGVDPDLSAVTIDIVAPSVEIGDFGWLAGGAIVGGLAFEGLNRIINARGGFLRKASTSITFLRDRDLRRRRAILDGLERIDIFDGLPDRELEAIESDIPALEERLKRDGEWRLLGYNSPMVPAAKRFWELQLPVQSSDAEIEALAAAGLMVVGINVIRARSPLPEDTSIGVLFVGLGWKQWSGRPTGDEQPTMPGWMRKRPVAASTTTVAFSQVNLAESSSSSASGTPASPRRWRVLVAGCLRSM